MFLHLKPLSSVYYISLAHDDVRSNHHVALKILTADSDGGEHATFELAILEHIKHTDPSNPGASHVISLLDHFRHKGSHGDHLCLVFKAMGPNLSTYGRRFPQLRIPVCTMKQMTRQLLLALSYLHKSCRIIHTGESQNTVPEARRMLDLTDCTDIKPQNILLETAKINDMFDNAPSTVLQHSSPIYDAPDDHYMESEELVAANEGFDSTPPPPSLSVRLTDFGTGKLWRSIKPTNDIESDA
jgi:serine/threonine-protein kinase SRPK3